jgi:hypothetical protein
MKAPLKFGLIIGLGLLQITVIVGFIAIEEHKKSGTITIRLPSRGYDPFSPFRGRFVRVRPQWPWQEDWSASTQRGTYYLELTRIETGEILYSEPSRETPEHNNYLIIKNSNWHHDTGSIEYYLQEDTAIAAERWIIDNSGEIEDLMEIEFQIYKGEATPVGLYFEGIPVEDYPF